MNNTLKTIALLGILSVILITFGGIVGGRSGIYSAFFFSLLMNGGMYFFSDKVALSMSGAKPMKREDYPEIYTMVEGLSRTMNLPMPALYITPDQQANAFATGRGPGHSAVAVTEGIMRVLPPEELKGVLAHELAHIKNRDVLTATIAAVMASTISFLANMSFYGGFGGGGDDDDNRGGGVMAIVAALLVPLGASIIQMAISRQREFAADESGAKACGGGEPLAQALLAIHSSAQNNPMQHNPALSSLYIGDPTGGLGSKMLHLFSTHPPVEERVKRLRAL